MSKNTTHLTYALRLVMLLLMICPAFSDTSLAQAARQDTSALTASLEPASVRVGDIVLLTLDYRLPDGARLPEKPDIRGLEGITVLTLEQQPGRIEIRLLVDRILPWKSGQISLTYIAGDGHPQEMATDPVTLAITSNLGEKPDEAQLKALQGILPAVKWRSYLLWTAVITCSLLAFAGLLWWFKKRRAVQKMPKIEEPPHVQARKKIEQLVARRLFESGKIKEFYFGFSEIIRRYLAAIRHFPAAEFTTEEIAQAMTADRDRALLPLLRRSDLIKFADDIPTVIKKEEDLRAALSYIEETRPAASADPATGGLGRSRP